MANDHDADNNVHHLRIMEKLPKHTHTHTKGRTRVLLARMTIAEHKNAYSLYLEKKTKETRRCVNQRLLICPLSSIICNVAQPIDPSMQSYREWMWLAW
jgi:hypothetical protein